MADIKSIEANVRSKVQEAVDEFVQTVLDAEKNPEMDSDILTVQIRVIGIMKPRAESGSSILLAKRDVKA